MSTRTLIAATAAASLFFAGLLYAPSAEAADADCEVVDLAPAVVAMGLGRNTKVTFDVGTDCDEDEEIRWWLTGRWPDQDGPWGYPLVANAEQPANSRYEYAPGGRFTWTRADDQRVGPMNFGVSALIDNGDDEDPEYLPVSTQVVSVVHRTTWGTTFNASPEPRRRGQSIKITGKLKYANWATQKYQGFGAYVMLQFRPAGEDDYQNVKWVWCNGAEAKTTVTAVKTGSWRFRYMGDSTHGASSSRGDTVSVRR